MKKLSITLTKNQIILGWVCIVLHLLVLPVLLSTGNVLLGSPLTLTGLNLVMFGMELALVLLIYHRFLWYNLQIGIARPFHVLRSAFFGFVAYFLFNLVLSYAVFYFFPGYSNANDSNIQHMYLESPALIHLATVLIAPIVEETLYRGVVFGGLYNRSRVLAYTVSTLFFAAIHVIGYIGLVDMPTLLASLVLYMPAGLLFGWAYVRADSIWAPILIHMTVNQLSIMLMR